MFSNDMAPLVLQSKTYMYHCCAHGIYIEICGDVPGGNVKGQSMLKLPH